jgi:hypothetical protein
LDSREEIISGEPRQMIDCLDQILSLGREDANSPIVSALKGKDSLTTPVTRCRCESCLMELVMPKIYERLKIAQSLIINKEAGKWK